MPAVTASGNELSPGLLVALLVFTGVYVFFSLCILFTFLFFSLPLYTHTQSTGSTKARIDDLESQILFEVTADSVDMDYSSVPSNAEPGRRFFTRQRSPIIHVQNQPLDLLSISTSSPMEPLDRGLPPPSSNSPRSLQATYALAETAEKRFRGFADNNDANEQPQYARVYPLSLPLSTTLASVPGANDAPVTSARSLVEKQVLYTILEDAFLI